MRVVESLKICTLTSLFCPKHIYKDLGKKVQKSYVSWHWRMMQSLKKKLTLDSKNDMRNLVNFNVSSGKSENLHFDVLLFSIAYKVSAKKVRKNDLSWHWIKRFKLRRKTDFLFEKWHEEFGNFNPASLKICTLTDYFCRNYVVFELKKIQRSCVMKSDIMT